MTVALIPYRDSPERRPLLVHVCGRLDDARIAHVVGGCGDGPWRKGVAVARARSKAADAAVLVVHDADSFVDDATLHAGIGACEDGAAWVHPHRIVARYSRQGTQAILAGEIPLRGSADARRPSLPGGGIVILRADVFDDVGGIDPRFCGWGGEDMAFGLALATLHGPPIRLRSTLHHLWHPSVAGGRARRRPEMEPSRVLLERYRAANGDRLRMREIIDEREAP